MLKKLGLVALTTGMVLAAAADNPRQWVLNHGSASGTVEVGGGFNCLVFPCFTLSVHL